MKPELSYDFDVVAAVTITRDTGQRMHLQFLQPRPL